MRLVLCSFFCLFSLSSPLLAGEQSSIDFVRWFEGFDFSSVWFSECYNTVSSSEKQREKEGPRKEPVVSSDLGNQEKEHRITLKESRGIEIPKIKHKKKKAESNGCVLIFVADWCLACQRLKTFLESENGPFDLLRQQGWRINEDHYSHVMYVDTADHPDLAMKCEIDSIPSAVMIEDGKVVRRWNNTNQEPDFDQWMIGWLYNGTYDKPIEEGEWLRWYRQNSGDSRPVTEIDWDATVCPECGKQCWMLMEAMREAVQKGKEIPVEDRKCPVCGVVLKFKKRGVQNEE